MQLIAPPAISIEEKYAIGKVILPDRKRAKLLTPGAFVTEKDVQLLRDHYHHRPIDRIRDGLLKIIDKSGTLVSLVPNFEQLELLQYIESEYYKRLPVRFSALKPRQIGLSTISEAIIFCLLIDSSFKTGHIVANKRVTSRRMQRMFLTYYNNLPEPLRPRMTRCNHDHMEFNDPDYGCENTFIRLGSAEERDKLGIGDTCQFNHFTEVAEWPSVAELMAALNPSIPAGWPSIVGRESTGKAVGDLFYTDFHEAYAGRKPGWKAFFWEWFKHEEYRLPLAPGLSPAEFVGRIPEDLRTLGIAYNLDVEQLNWYWTTEREWGSGRESKDGLTEVFRNKYPSSVEEAFAGGGSNFFNPEFLRRDAYRVERTEWLNDFADLPENSCLDLEAPVCCIKAGLHRDESAPVEFRKPAFAPDPMGEWRVWELPRQSRIHKYFITVDVAEGKQSIKGARESTDYSVADIWRYTYGEKELCAIVQVAQIRTQAMDPHEFAREVKAAAILYHHKEAGAEIEAMVMPESNAVGAAFVAQGMQLGMRFYRQNRSNTRYDGAALQQEIGFRQKPGGGDGSRVHMLTQGRECWRIGNLIINSQQTVREMGVFAQNDKGKYEAIRPHHDDTVITAMFAPEGAKFLTGVPGPLALVPVAVPSFHPRHAAMFAVHEEPPKIDLTKYIATPPDKRPKMEDSYAVAI